MDIRDEVMSRVQAELSQGTTDVEAAITRVVQLLMQEGRGEELRVVNWDLEADLAMMEAERCRREAAFLGLVEDRVPEEKTVREVLTEEELARLRRNG